MKTATNYVFHANPIALIVVGLLLIWLAMVAFAWVTWPEGFVGTLKTVVALLTSVLAGP